MVPMRLQAGRLAAALTATLAGCASLHPELPPVAVPNGSAVDVAGAFSQNSRGGFGFVLRHAETGVEPTMPLADDGVASQPGERQVVAVRLPPSRDVVAQWITVASLTKEITSRAKVDSPLLSAPFQVDAGTVRHLGDFLQSTGSTDPYPKLRPNWSVRPHAVSRADAQQRFVSSYPAFADSRIVCRLCRVTATQPAP